MPDQEPSGEGPATISVQDSQGTQVGPGNVQHNYYGHRPLRDLATLSLHAGVAYIRQLTKEEAVDLFGHTRPDDLTDKLALLLRTDEAMVLQILADLNQAGKVIGPLTDDFPWLAGLPNAAAAIAQQALDLRWTQAHGAGGIERAPRSPQGTDGYFQQFEQGRVYWRDEGRAHPVRAAITAVHLTVGGTGGELGFPRLDESYWAPDSGTKGTWQAFEGGYIESSPQGTYVVSGEIGIEVVANDLEERRLGFPLAAAAEVTSGVTRQLFEGGAVYTSHAGTFKVWRDFEDLAVTYFYAISSEEEIPSTDSGRTQRFERVWDGMRIAYAIYSSAHTEACRVSGAWLALYERLGGPTSSLGFPVCRITNVKGGRLQQFQHGTIYHQKDRDPIAVPADTVALAGDRLGWPVSGEESIGDSPVDRIQRFEKGIVTRRSGKLELWLGPVPAEGPPATPPDAAPPA